MIWIIHSDDLCQRILRAPETDAFVMAEYLFGPDLILSEREGVTKVLTPGGKI